MERVFEGYEIGINRIKVVVIIFSVGSRLEFDFNRYNIKVDVL